MIMLGGLLSQAPAALPSPRAAGGEPTPPQIHQLLGLLADPQVQAWLKQHDAAKLAATADPNPSAIPVSHYFDMRVSAMREHLVALAAAIPDLPKEFERGAALVSAELGARGRVKILLHLAALAGLGFGAEWLFRSATARIRRRLDGLRMESVRHRLWLIAARFAFAAGLVAAFAIGSIGPFLALDWAPLLREILLGCLVVLVVVRIAVIIGHLVLAPDHERFRIIPIETAAARFWCRRLTVFVGWFTFGWVVVGLCSTLGYSRAGREIVAYAFGLGLLAIALETVWRRPVAVDEGAAGAALVGHRLGRGPRNALLSIGIVLLWLLWVVGATPSFWLVLVVIALPLAIGVTGRAVKHVLRPTASSQGDGGAPSVVAIGLERGLRALLIIAAAAVLAWGWGMDMDSLGARDTMFGRLMHGILSAVVIVLVADVIWHAAKAAIDCKLAEAAEFSHPSSDTARRRARLRTLLPVFRNILFVVVIVVAAMMALAALGVEIGPLIAGASVVGVAIGLGAQNFVRDVIAGMFYLIDDAFRVGEYIQSGTYKGTVEGFSLRSIRLRHHRGPLYTVPFGLLGAVQNQSRDWVIDKMTVGITYDSDLEKARKLIKQIGLELAQDPEFAPLILEPLKMQGVEQFGDYAVQIRMKMMTLPGEQFVIRRKAYAMIKKAFDANGIKFAFPTVQLAGEGEAATAAVAQQGLELTRPPAAA
jgi:small-conductance mechanosensitive channel